MNFSTETIKLLDYIAEKFGIAIDWSSENIMPILQELAQKYITWEILTSIAWIVIGVIGVIISIALFRYDVKEVQSVILSAVGIGAALVFAVVVIYQIFDILRCTAFPELQILRYAQSVINSLSQNSHPHL